MARRAKLMGTAARVYLCDTFQGVVKAGSSDRHYGGEYSDTSEAIVGGLAGRLGLDNIKILSGIFPEQTGRLVENAAFRLWHIDVDVYESGRKFWRGSGRVWRGAGWWCSTTTDSSAQEASRAW